MFFNGKEVGLFDADWEEVKDTLILILHLVIYGVIMLKWHFIIWCDFGFDSVWFKKDLIQLNLR